MVRATVSIAIAFALSACATAPSAVPAGYTSPLMYRDLSCADIRDELARVDRRARAAAGRQFQDAVHDTSAMVAGVFIFWPALLTIGGNKNRAELANLKGQQEALLLSAAKGGCDLTVESVKTELVGSYVPPLPPGGHEGPRALFSGMSSTAAIDKIAARCLEGGFNTYRASRNAVICQGTDLASGAEFRARAPATDPLWSPQLYHAFVAQETSLGAKVAERSTQAVTMPGTQDPKPITPRLTFAASVNSHIRQLYQSLGARVD